MKKKLFLVYQEKVYQSIPSISSEEFKLTNCAMISFPVRLFPLNHRFSSIHFLKYPCKVVEANSDGNSNSDKSTHL